MSTVRHARDNSDPASIPLGVARADAELLAALEAERLPRGAAFTWHGPDVDQLDAPDAVEQRRAELVDALTEPLAPGWNPRAARRAGQACPSRPARLRVVA